jgi:hypothetical protein
MKCLMCGYDDDYNGFLYDYDENGEVIGLRCPECNNDDPDEIVNEDDIRDDDEW